MQTTAILPLATPEPRTAEKRRFEQGLRLALLSGIVRRFDEERDQATAWALDYFAHYQTDPDFRRGFEQGKSEFRSARDWLSLQDVLDYRRERPWLEAELAADLWAHSPLAQAF